MDPWVLLFWLANGVLALTYIVYPVFAWTAVAIKGRRPRFQGSERKEPPKVAFVIPAFNEEAVIGAKIRNTLALRYPAGLLRVIAVTDGSTDRTSQIACSFPGVLTLHGPERRGKPHAMNRGAAAMGDADVLVFSDANTLLEEDALFRLVAPFCDPDTGAVSGEKRVLNPAERISIGESAYWDYESRLKSLDADLHTVVGPVGELMALRAGLWQPLPENTILDDLHIGLRICLNGSRVAYAPDAVAVEQPSRSLSEEWERKVRISAGAFQSMGLFAPLLNPFRHGIASFQFLFRKVLRWTLCPPALLMALPVSSLAFWGGAEPGWVFLSAFVFWVLFTVSALTGWMFRGSALGRLRPFQLPFHFIFLHVAAMAGLLRFLLGGQSVLWRKAVR